MLLIGKPSISMGHLYHGKLLVITRGYKSHPPKISNTAGLRILNIGGKVNKQTVASTNWMNIRAARPFFSWDVQATLPVSSPQLSISKDTQFPPKNWRIGHLRTWQQHTKAIPKADLRFTLSVSVMWGRLSWRFIPFRIPFKRWNSLCSIVAFQTCSLPMVVCLYQSFI